MKYYVFSIILALMTALAFASVEPKQVEQALIAGNYVEAQVMIAQVIQEHPSSARAHLLNAFILAKKDKNKTAAVNELNLASALDKRGDVKNSPLFGRTVSEIDAIKVSVGAPVPTLRPVPSTPVQSQPAVPATTKSEGMSGGMEFFLCTLVILAIVILVYYWLRDSKRESGYVYTNAPYKTETNHTRTNTTGYIQPAGQPLPTASAPLVSTQPSYVQPPQTVVVQQPAVQQNGGLGIGGTMLGVAGGVLAAEAISSSLKNNHRHDDEYERRIKNLRILRLPR